MNCVSVRGANIESITIHVWDPERGTPRIERSGIAKLGRPGRDQVVAIAFVTSELRCADLGHKMRDPSRTQLARDTIRRRSGDAKTGGEIVDASLA
jgi:hypothetical protein